MSVRLDIRRCVAHRMLGLGILGTGRLGHVACPLVGNGSFRVLEPAGIAVIVRRQPVSHLDHGKHPRCGPDLPDGGGDAVGD